MRDLEELIHDIMKKQFNNLKEVEDLYAEVHEFMESDASEDDKHKLQCHCESLAITYLILKKQKQEIPC